MDPANLQHADWSATTDQQELGIAVVDDSWRVIYANPAALQSLPCAATASHPIPLNEDFASTLRALSANHSSFQTHWPTASGATLQVQGWPINPGACLLITTHRAHPPQPTQPAKIAHDLNNVFSNILMSSEILRTLCADPFILEVLDRLDSNARRGVELVRSSL